MGTGTTRQFKAQVHGTSEKVVAWSIRSPDALDATSQPPDSGSISQDGVYTATSAPSGPWAIIATSVAEPRARGIAQVTVDTSTVAITKPASGLAEVMAGGTFVFQAEAKEDGTTVADPIVWSIVEGSPLGGTISSSGLYTAPPHAGTFQVRATNASKPKISSVATVVVGATKDIRVTVSPKEAVLVGGEQIRLSAEVVNAHFNTVAWQVFDDDVPAFDAWVDPFYGVFEAPERSSTADLTVRAYSTQDPTVTDEAEIKVLSQPPAGTVAGWISYTGPRSGPVFITCTNTEGRSWSTGITPPGDFRLYTDGCTENDVVTAWMDTLGTGNYVYAASPRGETTVSATGEANITLIDPPDSSSVAPPSPMSLIPGDGEAIVFWEPPIGNDGEDADRYRVYAAPFPHPGPFNAQVVRTVRAGAGSMAIVHGLAPDTAYYFSIASIRQGRLSAPAAWSEPVLIASGNESAEGGTIRGSIFIPSEWGRTGARSVRILTARGGDPSTAKSRRISFDSGGTKFFSFTGLEPGTYGFAVFLDVGEDGEIGPNDFGDIEAGGVVDVPFGTTVAAPTIILPPPAMARVVTDVRVVGGVEESRERAQLVAAGETVLRGTLIAGPAAALTFFDLHRPQDNGAFPIVLEYASAWHVKEENQNSGQAYTFLFHRPDFTAANRFVTLTGYVTPPGVTAPPEPPDTVTEPFSFVWTAPTSAGGSIVALRLEVWDSNGFYWSAEPPASATSLLYSGETLTASATYNWRLSVTDSNGNTGVVEREFEMAGQ